MSSVDTPNERLPDKVRRLGVSSTLYFLATLLTQGVQFLLVPLYTRVMTPADYGILTLTTTVNNLLVIVLGLDLAGAVQRVYFNAQTTEERREFFGTILAFSIVVPGLATLGLDRAGAHGWLELFRNVPFHPYLRLTLWTAYGSTFFLLLTTAYATAERPMRLVLLSVLGTAVNVGMALLFVVARRQGAVGMLRAGLIGNVLLGVVSCVLLARMAAPVVSMPLLKQSLVYVAPLVVHVTANWAMSLSDRFILEAHVTVAAMGIYSLAVQIGSIVLVVATSVNTGFSPMAMRLLKQTAGGGDLPQIGSYAVAVTAATALAVALLGGDLIRLVTPPAFHAAAALVPWIAAGYALLGVYYVVSIGTFFSMRTRWVPVVTWAVAGGDIALNLWLIPRYGIRAAAIDFAIAYGALALLHAVLAQRLHRIAWPWRRWLRLALAAGGSYAVGRLAAPSWLAGSIAVHAAALLVLFPVLLFAVRFLRRDDWAHLRAALALRRSAA